MIQRGLFWMKNPSDKALNAENNGSFSRSTTQMVFFSRNPQVGPITVFPIAYLV